MRDRETSCRCGAFIFGKKVLRILSKGNDNDNIMLKTLTTSWFGSVVLLKYLTCVLRRLTMKEFNAEKFCKDLIALRGKESQDKFAQKLKIKRPTLSLLENGKQMPTIDILSLFCNLSGNSTDDYFVESTTDALVYLMGSMEETDKIKVEELAERIRIKEKYELLAKRGSYVID